MSIAADLALPYVTVTLDTTPPRLALVGPATVQPPDDLAVVLSADKPLSWITATFTDSLGRPFTVGGQRMSDRSFRIVVPSVEFTTGGGTLHVGALDDVCNAAVIDLPVLIDRPRVLDLVVESETAFEVKMSESTPFEMTTVADSALAMDLFQGGAHEVALTDESAFSVEMETDDGE